MTGEAISQVSSQTLPNLSVIDRVTDTLVLRPLIVSHRTSSTPPADRHRRVRPAHAGILRVISVNPTTQAKFYRVEHEESKFDMAVLERALGEPPSAPSTG